MKIRRKILPSVKILSNILLNLKEEKSIIEEINNYCKIDNSKLIESKNCLVKKENELRAKISKRVSQIFKLKHKNNKIYELLLIRSKNTILEVLMKELSFLYNLTRLRILNIKEFKTGEEKDLIGYLNYNNKIVKLTCKPENYFVEFWSKKMVELIEN